RRSQQRKGRWRERQRFDDLADAPHPRPSAGETKRNVSTNRGSADRIAMARPPKHCSRVRPSAAKTSARGYALVQPNERSTIDQVQRLGHKIVAISNDAGARDGIADDLEP